MSTLSEFCEKCRWKSNIIRRKKPYDLIQAIRFFFASFISGTTSLYITSAFMKAPSSDFSYHSSVEKLDMETFKQADKYSSMKKIKDAYNNMTRLIDEAISERNRAKKRLNSTISFFHPNGTREAQASYQSAADEVKRLKNHRAEILAGKGYYNAEVFTAEWKTVKTAYDQVVSVYTKDGAEAAIRQGMYRPSARLNLQVKTAESKKFSFEKEMIRNSERSSYNCNLSSTNKHNIEQEI